MKNRLKLIFSIILLVIGGLCGFFGITFKIMHWPGHTLLRYSALPILIPGVVLLVSYLRKKDQ